MQFPSEAKGIVAALVAALFTNFIMTIGKLMQNWGWPYFILSGLASLFASIGLAITMMCHLVSLLGRSAAQCRQVFWCCR